MAPSTAILLYKHLFSLDCGTTLAKPKYVKNYRKLNITTRLLKFALCGVMTLNLFFAQQAYAGETENKIAQQSAEIAIKTTSIDAIDKYANATLNINPSAVAYSPIAQSLAVYNLGMSLKSFAEADSDKGRLFAAMDTAASVAMMINPALGVIVQLAVLAVKMIDANLSIAHQKRMLEILKKIKEYQEQYYSDLTKTMGAEKHQLNSAFDRLNYAMSSISTLQPEILKQCSLVNGDSGYDSFDWCFNNLRVLLLHYKQFNEAAQFIIEYKNDHFDISIIMKALKISKESLRKEVHENLSKISMLGKMLDAFEEYSSRSLAKTIQEQTEKAALLSTREAFYTSCLNDIVQIQAASIQRSLLKVKSKQTSLAQSDLLRNSETLSRLISLVEEKECFEIVNTDNNLELIGTMLKSRSEELSRISKKLAAEELN